MAYIPPAHYTHGIVPIYEMGRGHPVDYVPGRSSMIGVSGIVNVENIIYSGGGVSGVIPTVDWSGSVIDGSGTLRVNRNGNAYPINNMRVVSKPYFTEDQINDMIMAAIPENYIPPVDPIQAIL